MQHNCQAVMRPKAQAQTTARTNTTSRRAATTQSLVQLCVVLLSVIISLALSNGKLACAASQSSSGNGKSTTSMVGNGQLLQPTQAPASILPLAAMPSASQLFQSPAALAAAAAVAAAAAAASQQTGPIMNNQQQQQATNLIAPNSLISARVDTNELLKQAVQQSQQVAAGSLQQAASYNIEQGEYTIKLAGRRE